MAKKPTTSNGDAKAATPKRKSRAAFDVAFSVPKGISISDSHVASANAYYSTDPYSDGENDGHWGGKGAALLGLDASHLHRHVHVASHGILEKLSNPSPEALALADIALAFCKECRGWKNACCFNDWGYPYIVESVSKKLADTPIPPHQRQFHYTHLDRVMAAVRVWLKPTGTIPAHHSGMFVDVIPTLFDKYFFGELDDGGLCRELMAACVAAHRQK
jgi:hypothetical protein